jgi:hypothetical protein
MIPATDRELRGAMSGELVEVPAESKSLQAAACVVHDWSLPQQG